MPARYRQSLLFRFSVLTLALAAAGWLCPQPAAAGELDKLDTSLRLIPEDAAFYSSMMRNREQFEAIRHSNALAKIQEMPIVQMGLAFYNVQLATPGSRVAMLDAALRNPESRKVLDLAAEMVSDEIFIYGDKNVVDFVKLFQIVNAAQTYSPLVAQLTGQAAAGEHGQIQGRAVMTALAKNATLIGVPNLIVGFKVQNTDLAKEQLSKLETLANNALQAAGVDEQTKSHFKRSKVGDYEYLVADLDGSMIPWDQVPLEKIKELEAQPGDAQKIIDRLKQSKLVVALGVRGNYLLCLIGSSLECLEKLGKDKRLLDRAELKPLEKYVDKRLLSVGYKSQAMSRQLNNQKKQLDDLLAAVDQLLPGSSLSDEQKERVRNDAKALLADLKAIMPEAGPSMGLSFLTDRGIEGYRYAWGSHGPMDGSKPLGLLQHVGGNPLLGLVARQKVSGKDYDLMVKWAKTAYGYFREFGLPLMKDNEREKLEKFLGSALPLLERMDKANREMLLPALADGQSALVIDRKLASKHFVEQLPATEKSLPMVEPALVIGVSDAGLLKNALSEYKTIVNELIDAVRQIEGSNVPADFRIPDPQVTESSAGTIYSFPLPEEWGVDKQIVPNFGLSERVAVLSASQGHTERLLKQTPLGVGGVLADAGRPLAAAVWFDWAALVEAAAPWVDFAAAQAMASKDIDEDQQKATLSQVHTALDVLKVLRSITNESYLDGGVLVHHTLVELRDVEK